MSRVFVDTNVLVYADQSQSKFHRRARAALSDLERADAELWISRQVVREYLAAVTRPDPSHPERSIMPGVEAIAAAEGFLDAYWIAEDSPVVTRELLRLIGSIEIGGRQIHDANIVATMRAYQIEKLLTFNVVDFARYKAEIEILPLPD